MAIPAGWDALGFTSGRRTYKGNRLVGGVPRSEHLRGTAADFTAPLSVLQAQFPGHPILNEGDHRHVSGLSDVPYYGNRGTAGLVNGVDTTAPKGNTMLRPRKPNYAGMSQPMGGIDPLAPTAPPPQTMQDAYQQMIGNVGPMSAQPNFGAMSQPDMSGHDPLAPHKKRSILPLILGVLGDGLAAYGGRQGVFAPTMMDQMNQDREDNRFQERLAAQSERDRQIALAKAQEPTELMQRVGDLNRLKPGLGDEYAKNYAGNGGGLGIKLFTDPATGQTYNIGGGGQSGPPSKTLPDGSQAWFVNGDWYDNPEGR